MDNDVKDIKLEEKDKVMEEVPVEKTEGEPQMGAQPQEEKSVEGRQTYEAIEKIMDTLEPIAEKIVAIEGRLAKLEGVEAEEQVTEEPVIEKAEDEEEVPQETVNTEIEKSEEKEEEKEEEKKVEKSAMDTKLDAIFDYIKSMRKEIDAVKAQAEKVDEFVPVDTEVESVKKSVSATSDRDSVPTENKVDFTAKIQKINRS